MSDSPPHDGPGGPTDTRRREMPGANPRAIQGLPESLLGWWREAPTASRRTLWAAGLGWMLDAFDVMLYAMVLAELLTGLGMTKATGGLLGSLTLLASAAGGMIFGVVADRLGRVRALIWSILIYSVFTAACGLAQTVTQLAVFRICLGLGMGGEWASGAALVSETWPSAHRGKAMAFMQSFWAVGYAAAALVAALVLPAWGWRGVFLVGVLPALFTLWIRRRVEESPIWRRQSQLPPDRTAALGRLWREGLLPVTGVVTLMNACTMFAWWGFNLWVPAYLTLKAGQGGAGLTTWLTSGLVIFMQLGMWLGYLSFGFLADRFGRKRTYVAFLLGAALGITLYSAARDPWWLLGLGPVVAFFGTGYFSGFGALTAELYPTAIRATAQGFTYNLGRVASAAAPFWIGSLAQVHGFGAAFLVVAAAFLLAAVWWVWIPETRGRELT